MNQLEARHDAIQAQLGAMLETYFSAQGCPSHDLHISVASGVVFEIKPGGQYFKLAVL